MKFASEMTKSLFHKASPVKFASEMTKSLFHRASVAFHVVNLELKDNSMEKIARALNESAAIRWLVLLLVSISMAANYYFYDALSPLKQYMGEFLGFSSADYGIFVSAYSFPNVFLAMAVLGGIICDRLGIRITGTTFALLMVFGSFFYCIRSF